MEKKIMKINEYPAVISFRVTVADKQKFDELVSSVPTSKSKFIRDRFIKLLIQKKVRQ
jgi:hypothetical protein